MKFLKVLIRKLIMLQGKIVIQVKRKFYDYIYCSKINISIIAAQKYFFKHILLSYIKMIIFYRFCFN